MTWYNLNHANGSLAQLGMVRLLGLTRLGSILASSRLSLVGILNGKVYSQM